jgi:replication fork protection complex subunit Tof1/Swi1
MDEDGHPKPELHKVRRKKAVETQVFKSAAFIEDSDDDEERDMAFFARERVLRQEMEELARRQGNDLMDAGRMKRKRKGKGKERNVRETQLDEEDMEMLQRGRSQSQGTSRQRGGSPRVETESDEEAPRRKRRSSPLVAPLSDQGSEGASSLPLGSAGVKMSGRVRRIVDTDSDE